MKTVQVFLAVLSATFLVVPPLTAQRLEKSDKLIGMVIADSHDQRVGKVSELAVDLTAGRIAVVLVDTGGYLTSNHRIVAVPPELLSLDDLSEELFLNADLDAFDAAPALDLSVWNNSMPPASVIDVYKRFHVQPYPNPGYVQRSARIVGLPVNDPQKDRLGSIQCLIVSLPGGQIPDVMIGSSQSLGLKNQWTAVPPQAFICDIENKSTTLETTKQAFRDAPHFKASEWRNFINSDITAVKVTQIRELTDD